MSKYHSTKVTLDGLVFDSKREAQRYAELRLLERAGEIYNLRRQIKIPLLPKQEKTKYNSSERAVDYIADFVYCVQEGHEEKIIVEDVKGYTTKDYIIKRKLFKWRYPQYIFKEIK